MIVRIIVVFESTFLGVFESTFPRILTESKDTILSRFRVQAVKKGLDTGIPLLADKYAKSVLLNMQEDIHVAVQTAIIDSIPESWSPASDSVILSRQQETRICSWVAAQKKHPVKLQLLYRASRDGWKGMDFHSRCDNKGATITVIKRTDQSGNVLGRIFGGYADVAWNSNGVVTDPSAFVFSMSAGSVGSTDLRVGDRVQLKEEKQRHHSLTHPLRAGIHRLCTNEY